LDEEDIKNDKPLFKAGVYDNPWKSWTGRKSIVDATKWYFTRKLPKKYTSAELDKLIPVEEPNWEAIKNPDRNVIQITWIGHSTFLVQMDGINILTDPVFGPRTSPFTWIGPPRIRRLPIKLDQLPEIDLVIISHSHYDHLDYQATEYIMKNKRAKYYVPKGLKSWFDSKYQSRVSEMSWWTEEIHEDKLDVICTPCQHWSNRSPFDACKTLWSSWVISQRAEPKKRLFFCGDTGYCPVFPKIGEYYGPFDLSMIPIGNYCPRHFMSPQHIDPKEAVLIHQEIKSKKKCGHALGHF